MNEESLSKTVLRLREAKGWSQQKLADEAKVSYHTVFRAEAGGELKTGSLRKLAKALEVSESELLGNPHPGQGLTIDAIKEAVKESLKESKKIDSKSPSHSKNILLALIDRLDDGQIQSLIPSVRGLLGESALDDSEVPPGRGTK